MVEDPQIPEAGTTPPVPDPVTPKDVEDSPAIIDEKIKQEVKKRLSAREKDIEIRELKLKEQTDTVSKMLEEVRQGGQGVAPTTPQVEDPIEYSKKLERGEVNPFKEDGIKA